MEQKYSVRRLMRMMNVIVLYQFELFNEKIDVNYVFEKDIYNNMFNYEKLKTKYKDNVYKEQINVLTNIEKNYLVFKNLINKYTRDDWKWDRINPITRSVLLCAIVEILKQDNDLAVIANEYIEIAKDFIPDNESYKFVNIIIEKIGNEYNEFKKSKSS